MIDYEFFYNIAEYGNANWKGNFSPKEVACFAYDYLIDFDASKREGKLTELMQRLICLLKDDKSKECRIWLYQIINELKCSNREE